MSANVLKLIDAIAATPGKNDKQAMVIRGMENPLFKRACKFAYDPFKTYGIRQIPGKTVAGGRGFESVTWEILDCLVSRELTGNAARVAIEAEINTLDEASADLFVRIIRKDLRAGFSESTINKACKGLIPDFPYMRCTLPKDAKLETWPFDEGVISQEKADGMFANVDHEESGLVSVRSRQGSEFPIERFPNIVAEIQARTLPGHQHHGEFVVVRGDKILPREIGNGILNSVLSGGDFEDGEYPKYLIWDQIPLSKVVTKGKHETPYKDRLGGVIKQLRTVEGTSVALIPTRIVKSLADAYAHAGELMKLGKEGTVIKHPKAIWKDGTSKEQVKIKLEFDVDLEVVAIVPGNVGTRNEGRAGSLTCRSSCGGLQTDVTVKNETMRTGVDTNPEEWIGKIIAVTANDIMKPSESNEIHSLFLPRMIEDTYRSDKTEADNLQRIFDIKQAAIFGEKLKEAA